MSGYLKRTKRIGPPDDFAVLILTHGRPDRVFTLEALRKAGWTGPTYLVIDDEDATADEYRRIHGGDRVVQFSKQEIADRIDEGDNFNDRRCIVYARNAAFDVAEQLGYRYFVQLDDDYTWFAYHFDSGRFYRRQVNMVDLDAVWTHFLEFYRSTPFATIAFAQAGDFPGGPLGSLNEAIYTKRKAMNSLICSTDRRFEFPGRLNEDVISYTALQRRGMPVLTVCMVSLNQTQTQAGSGGMSEIYQSQGTYVKSFYAVMHEPSGVVVYPMGTRHPRLHHRVNYNAVAPKIISERHRKAS